MGRKKRSGRLNAASRLSSVGIELSVAVIGGLLLGWWLDEQFETTPTLSLCGIIFGSVVGFWGLYRVLKMYEEAQDDDESGA